MNYSLAVEPFDVWGFDYMGPFPSSNGYTHISVDHNTSIKMLKEVIFPRFGVPRYVMTDGGSHFIHGAFHPQSSGEVELSNREIKLILQKTINRSRKNWSKKLDDALWAYRTAYKNPMGLSPYKMVYGKACHLSLELEHKAYWAVKELNYDFKLAGERGYLILAH